MTVYIYTEKEQTTINNAVDEAVSSWVRQKTLETSEKDLRKDIIERITKDENVPIDKKLFNLLVKERFDGKSSEEVEKHEDVIALDDILRKKQSEEED